MTQREFKVLAELGASGSGCDAQNAKFQVALIGNPTSGTFLLFWTIMGVTESLEFGTNMTASEAQTVMETHSQIGPDDIVCSLGPWPNATLQFEFIGALANKDIAVPGASWTYMAGGYGMGIIPSCVQKGHA